MAEQLGELAKPSAEGLEGARKLFLVPLILAPRESESDLKEIVDRYWSEVQVHIENLEARLGPVRRVYHELIPGGGDEAIKAIEELSAESFRVVKGGLEKGAELEAMEDGDLITELMDWTKCLAVGLQNERVWNTVYEAFVAVQKKRNEHIATRIDESLKEGEAGVVLIREGHQVQFPTDIEVFYVAPPALDEMKRWLRTRETASPSAGQETEEDSRPLSETEAGEETD